MSGLVAASAWAGAWGALWVSGSRPLDKGKSGSKKTGLAQSCWLESGLLTLFPFNELIHCVLKWGSHSCGVVRALALRGVTTKRKQEFGPKPSQSSSSCGCQWVCARLCTEVPAWARDLPPALGWLLDGCLGQVLEEGFSGCVALKGYRARVAKAGMGISVDAGVRGP